MNEETIYPNPFAPTEQGLPNERSEQKKYVKVIGHATPLAVEAPLPTHNLNSRIQALSLKVQRLEERMEKLIQLAEVHQQALEAIAVTMKEE